MKTIYQLQQIAARLREVTEVNSISPEDTFGLQADVLEYLADMEQNAEGLGIHKVYASYAAMVADASAPVGSNGKALRFGQLVVIYDSSNTTQAESGNVYAWQKGNTGAAAWLLMGNLGSISKNAVFAGIATPTTNPGTPDGPVFYIATEAGTYSNFGGISVADGEAVILQWNNGAWTKKTTGLTTQQEVDDRLTELGKTKVSINNNSETKVSDNSDGFYFTDKSGNVIAKILSDGIHAVALYDKDGNEIGESTGASIESIKDKIKQDGFYFTDAIGNVIAKITKDGLQAIKILDKDGNEIGSADILGDDNTIPIVFSNKLIATSVKPHSLFGKYIYSIGDSHTYAYMEKLSELTGAIYDSTIHKNILLENEKLPGVHTMCTQAHAMVNWFKAGNPIDAIFIENVHHLFNDGIEVQPYENNVLYDGGSFSTFAEMQEKMKGKYFDNLLTENLPTPNGAFVVSVLTSVQRVQFAFSSGGVCTGGSVSLKFEDVSGETYSASITVDSGMTLAEVVNKINTIQFDEFFQVWGNPKHHQDLGGKTYIDFQYTGDTGSDNKNRKILINTDDTTANVIIYSNTDASTSFNYYYCFWSRDVSKWSDKSYWHYQSGGAFTTDSMKYYKGMVEILQKNIPNCKLYIWTCPNIAVDWNTYTTSDDKIEITFEDGSIDIAKWKSSKNGAEDIKRAKGFNELAEYYNIPCLNIQDLWGVNVLNGKYFYKNNNVHLSGGEYSGYDRVAELLASLTH